MFSYQKWKLYGIILPILIVGICPQMLKSLVATVPNNESHSSGNTFLFSNVPLVSYTGQTKQDLKLWCSINSKIYVTPKSFYLSISKVNLRINLIYYTRIKLLFLYEYKHKLSNKWLGITPLGTGSGRIKRLEWAYLAVIELGIDRSIWTTSRIAIKYANEWLSQNDRNCTNETCIVVN